MDLIISQLLLSNKIITEAPFLPHTSRLSPGLETPSLGTEHRLSSRGLSGLPLKPEEDLALQSLEDSETLIAPQALALAEQALELAAELSMVSPDREGAIRDPFRIPAKTSEQWGLLMMEGSLRLLGHGLHAFALNFRGRIPMVAVTTDELLKFSIERANRGLPKRYQIEIKATEAEAAEWLRRRKAVTRIRAIATTRREYDYGWKLYFDDILDSPPEFVSDRDALLKAVGIARAITQIYEAAHELNIHV
jgi:hypothetical protein